MDSSRRRRLPAITPTHTGTIVSPGRAEAASCSSTDADRSKRVSDLFPEILKRAFRRSSGTTSAASPEVDAETPDDGARHAQIGFRHYVLGNYGDLKGQYIQDDMRDYIGKPVGEEGNPMLKYKSGGKKYQ